MERSGRMPGIVVALVLALGCSGSGDKSKDTGLVDAPGKDAPGVDAPGVDAPGVDAPAKDTGKPDSKPDLKPTADKFLKLDKCVPGCHRDCMMNGLGCANGKVYELGGGVVKCCTQSDPWPYPGPLCSTGKVLRTCNTNTCVSPDKRYASCTCFSYPPTAQMIAHLAWLYCPGSQTIKAGTACASDLDCRPAPVGTARLVCDTTKKVCKVAARPAAPAGYGGSCGVTPAAFPYKPSTSGMVINGKICTLCHAILEPSATCVRQACTYTCKYDEDCPAGSLCLYNCSGSNVTGICTAATDRTTTAGRTAGLKCPP